jgi:four helix bundle protein
MRDHTKLRAFDLADALALAVYKATANFPREEMFGLTSQLRRAAISIASNIVEGCARFSEAEYVHFLDMAYGSAREVEYQIGLSHRLGFLATDAHVDLANCSAETCKVLNGLLRALRPMQTGGRRPQAGG